MQTTRRGRCIERTFKPGDAFVHPAGPHNFRNSSTQKTLNFGVAYFVPVGATLLTPAPAPAACEWMLLVVGEANDPGRDGGDPPLVDRDAAGLQRIAILRRESAVREHEQVLAPTPQPAAAPPTTRASTLVSMLMNRDAPARRVAAP